MHTEIYEARKQIILDFMNDRQYRPMKLKEMCNILGVPRREREELKLVLDQLISEHEIDIDTKGRYKIADPEVLIGNFIGNTFFERLQTGHRRVLVMPCLHRAGDARNKLRVAGKIRCALRKVYRVMLRRELADNGKDRGAHIGQFGARLHRRL